MNQKLVVLTCYDYSTAIILDEAGVDILLVGDSLAMVMMGEPDTKSVSLEQMLPYALGVKRGAKKADVVFDMPIGTYKTPKEAHENAILVKNKTQIDYFKVEGRPDVIEYLVQKGLKVMGHTGLKPQTAESYKVVGRDSMQKEEVLLEALQIDQAGASEIVLECVPTILATEITSKVKARTIGIGAGPNCDGQVLVIYDLLDLYPGKRPKFVRPYMHLAHDLKKVVGCFIEDVRKGTFPSEIESY